MFPFDDVIMDLYNYTVLHEAVQYHELAVNKMDLNNDCFQT